MIELDTGMVAAAIARKTAAIPPPLLAEIDPALDEQQAGHTPSQRHDRDPRGDVELVITLPEPSLPDADTIASMQLIAKIPRTTED